MRKHPCFGRIAGYAFAIVFILAGWQLTAMAVRNPVLRAFRRVSHGGAVFR